MSDELVLGMDPGDTTGWSLWMLPDDAPAMRLSYGAIKGGYEGVRYWMETTLGTLRPSTIIFERFNPDLGYGKSKEYSALEIQGAVRAVGPALGIEVILHDNGMKALCRDADLKRLGFWITPREAKIDANIMHTDARDVNDSQIHVLAHAKAIDHEPTLAAFWPPITA